MQAWWGTLYLWDRLIFGNFSWPASKVVNYQLIQVNLKKKVTQEAGKSWRAFASEIAELNK